MALSSAGGNESTAKALRRSDTPSPRTFSSTSYDVEEGINVKAALCVAFAAFLRSGEFIWDTWSSNSHPSHLSRRLPCVCDSHPTVIKNEPISSWRRNPSCTNRSVIHSALSPCSDYCLIATPPHLYPRCSQDFFINPLPKHFSFLRCINCS
jgi:hypothetical protein